MNKKLIWLLSCLLIITGCNKDNPSEKESESESESISESIDLNEGNREVAIIDEYFEDYANNTLTTYNNAFEYASYTFNKETSSPYIDDDFSKLNDGISTKVFDKENWVGWYGKNYDITIDFTLDMSFSVSYFNVHMLQVVSYAIRYPEAVTLYASYDGKRYDKLSTIYTPSTLTEDSEYTYSFHYERYVAARYYRFFIKGLSNYAGSYFLFCDEIEAIEFDKDGEHEIGESDIIDNFYNYEIDTSTTFSYNPNDLDYNDHINLARLDNVDIDVKPFEKLTKTQAASNTKVEEINKLVDGNKASQVSPTDKNWVKFAYGYGRDIVFDFKDKVAIDTINMQLFNYMNSAINIPEKIAFYASDDGEKFDKVATFDTDKYQSTKNEKYDLSQEFEEPFATRYLMISFITNYNLTDIVRVYISEIEILGYKNKDKATKDYRKSNYVSSTLVENVCYVSPNIGKEKFMPFCAYLSKDGKILDYMFDCISLTFFTGLDNVSGKTLTEKSRVLTDEYMQGIKDINDDMQEVNETLKDNRKMKIFVSLPMESYPNIGFASGQKNYVDIFLEEFEKETLPNIELLGFYWNNEYVPGSTMTSFMNEMQDVNDYINDLGFVSFWCPFYMADGISRNEDTGCAFSCMQPNYMFNDVANDRLYSCARVASICNACVEIEIEAVNRKESINKYYEYLMCGITYGYMDTIKVYYQGQYSFYSAYKDNYKLYEATYLYAHKTLTYDFFKEEVSDISDYHNLSTTVNVTKESVTVNIENFKNDLNISIKQLPTYGDVKVELDGTITYYLNHGYLGNDYMIVTLSNNNDSKDIRIDFNITK